MAREPGTAERREGEAVEEAGNPGALALSRDLALHLAAALPAAGAPSQLELGEARPHGHSLHDGRYFHGHVAAELVASLEYPEHLTGTLETVQALAADLPSLVLLGQELARRLEA